MYAQRFLCATILATVVFAHSFNASADDAKTPPEAAQPAPEPATAVPSMHSNPEPEMPLRWAGSTFFAAYNATLTTFGVGRDYVGESNENSSINFGITPGYFLVEQPRHQLRLSTRIMLFVPLVDPNPTSRGVDPTLIDVPLVLTYTMQPFSSGKGRSVGGSAAMTDPTLLFGNGAYRTWLSARALVTFPTSDFSRAVGKYPNIGAALGIRQQIRLLGDGAGGLNHLLISFNESWSHTFESHSNSGLTNILSQDLFEHRLSLTLPLYRELQFATEFALANILARIPQGTTNCPIVFASGCTNTQTLDEPFWTNTTMQFGAHLSYLIVPEFAVGIGYTSASSGLTPTSTRTNPFYNQGATAHLNAALSIDRLYQRFASKP